MSIDISQLTNSIRPVLVAQGIPLKLGHTHQLLAAALGYRSLAAQQASGEPHELDSFMHWVVDEEQLRERAESLRQTIDTGVFISCLSRVSRQLGGPKVCRGLGELQDGVAQVVQDAAADDDEVGSRMAETNCTGPFMAYMEPSSVMSGPLPQVGEVIVIDYEGTVEGDSHTERPFSGDTIDVKAQAKLPVLGRRILGEPEVEVLNAALDWSWNVDAEDPDEEPTYTKIEALSIELEISLEDAALLDEAEIMQTTSSAGVPNGYIIDLTYCQQSHVVERLVERYDTYEIPVWGATFEYMRPDD